MRLFHHLQCELVGDNATLSGGWPQIPSPLPLTWVHAHHQTSQNLICP